jgi:peptidyl-prolyl cis-trans isomerase SurA
MNLHKNVLVVLVTLWSAVAVAQNNEVLLTIDNEQITAQEFLAIYNKNNVEIESAQKKSMEEYLELFINFKLKVHEAQRQGLDTTSAFQSELNGYVQQLGQPYLVDNQFTEALIQEAYDRLQYEVNASHILVKLPENPSPKDTLAAYNKAMKIYEQAKTDSDFTSLAVRNSDDPSVKQNGGDLGYFSAFRMVYPFESAAFNTPVGSVSKPVKTSFGYHILYVKDKRPARGEIKAAHIMVVANSKSTPDELARAEKKINEIYAQLEAGKSFREMAISYSDDRGSAQKGGDLGWFGAGRMVKSFEDAAFAIPENGAYSKPFQTQFGWHIVLREDLRKIGSFEEERAGIAKKVKQDKRSQGSEHALAVKLLKEYKVKTYQKNVNAFNAFIDSTYFQAQWNDSVAMTKKAPVMVINDKTYGQGKITYTQKDFAIFLKNKMRRRQAVNMELFLSEQFSQFVDAKIIAFESTILDQKYPEYKALVTEYHDGILLFEIMESQVWKKAMEDSAGLEAFYQAHQSEYMWNERVSAKIYTCGTEEAFNNTLKMIEENATDSAIHVTNNVNSELAVSIAIGKYQKEDMQVLASVPWEVGVHQVTDNGKYVIVNITEVLAPETKDLDDVRGLVTSAYQDELDTQWIEALRQQFAYTVNQEVFDSIKQ